jgi:hypothetical protein
MDRDGSGDLSLQEFTRGMRDYRILNLEHEIQAVFNIFETNGNGTLSYQEFFRHIVGEMNSRRRYIAEQAFDMISQGSSSLELQHLFRVYNAKQHPDVVAGRRSEDQVICEFLDTFEAHLELKRVLDGRVTLEDWLEYLNAVSCGVETDQQFETLIVHAFNL